MKYLKDSYQYPYVNKKEFLSMFPNSYGMKATKSKLIIKGLTLLDTCIDFDGSIIPGKSTMIIAIDNSNDLKFLSAIINSKLMIYFIKQKYSSSSYNGGINFTKNMINSLPIRYNNKEELIIIVDKIITAKQSNPTFDTSALEADIDKLVYKIYNLTDEEIAIVEGVDKCR